MLCVTKLSVANYFDSIFQISWSGCKDSQTSADTEEAGSATGAMSFVSILIYLSTTWFLIIPIGFYFRFKYLPHLLSVMGKDNLISML